MKVTALLSRQLLSTGCALLLTCLLAPAQTSQSGKGITRTDSSAKYPASKSQMVHKSTSTKSATSISPTTSRKGKKSNRKSKKTAANWRHRGQQKIDAQRAREIQEALIREHYLDGEATGVWNDAAQNAMERYQADNGWQSKTVPDARALIKLGLGPNHEHLLNPESAMTSSPQTPHAEPTSAPSPTAIQPQR